ncbi:ABC transporter permease [Pseudothauera rhizosphaerae]|uniref:MlaE family lipid ABC transporter permease subunit n=1 Tax=Pseudothauera rhizosphaerae TaxID=2565932 RepID=A0A4S4APU6_9RHOO|nr:MlaE family lipid ABC transporter permease subunit [Pseudothauera rhizosphaerae]THF61708.1 MlaE family lipid ABC transporter permease subunit [Pseudothauera rhizosphaerae]
MSETPFVRSADSAASTVPMLHIGGDWTLDHYRPLAARLDALRAQLRADTRIDIAALGALDTAGASLLFELLGQERLRTVLADATLAPERRALLQAVAGALTGPVAEAPRRSGSAIGDVLEHVGIATGIFWRNLTGLLGFIGITLECGLRILPRPWRWRLTSLTANLEKTGLDAVPIVALLTFLVGAVVAFLGATVLADFGASIFTVDLVAFSFLREFGVLLTAILVAGRTASAFTAQIGSMKANEEIDAIRVIGLDPVELLVLPRVAALLIALPILTFIAMLAGIVGGMLVCALTLDISPTMFLSIFENDVSLRHFLVGMAKAPVFAFLIAVIGCREGFKVAGSAQSVGEHTTSAVVQSIFVVILVDAVAALFYMEMGW